MPLRRSGDQGRVCAKGREQRDIVLRLLREGPGTLSLRCDWWRVVASCIEHKMIRSLCTMLCRKLLSELASYQEGSLR